MGQSDRQPGRRGSRLLDAVERFGNALPDPIFIFLGLIAILVVLSGVGAAQGWSAVNPVTGERLVVQNLLSEANVQRLLVEMPRTYTGFTPFGIAITIMLGAVVAERSGLMAALIRASLARVARPVMTPVVFLVGVLSCHTVDAGFLVYVPLAGLVFAAGGRNPALGVLVGFSGAAVGLSGNLFPGQVDVLLLSITETGARLLAPDWTMNPLGNWWFSAAQAVLFTAIAWTLFDRVLGPRLGAWSGEGGAAPNEPLSADERRGLAAAGVAALLVAGLFAALTTWPGYTPLYDEASSPAQRLLPFYRSLAGGLALLFFVCGWVYGAAVGLVRSHRDVVELMVRGLEPFIPYLVLMFFAAHFVAMFGWSNLGPITAIAGAEQLRAMNASPAILLPVLTTMSAWLDFLIASASAKWSAVAPVAVPMLMLLDISPEMTTAAYRIGDVVTNLISPMNPYFVLTLTYARRWMPQVGQGTMLALLLPLAAALYVGGMALTILWVALGIPVGPGAPVAYSLPLG
ncbi:MAG: AbgT family transporter [Phenylobacterium sp.]|uniref:AbgT family transporter n=1 Tax=Phenylobacterium sp. TaxID=1871053 RepID=UPI001A540277|nr:AbgT family transporter [Phenylobacterium sp.]MBL8772900.1 AbgT family transporter [Phenylobacterium sp.]